jgi:hypothetical protein
MINNILKLIFLWGRSQCPDPSHALVHMGFAHLLVQICFEFLWAYSCSYGICLFKYVSNSLGM